MLIPGGLWTCPSASEEYLDVCVAVLPQFEAFGFIGPFCLTGPKVFFKNLELMFPSLRELKIPANLCHLRSSMVPQTRNIDTKS